MWSKTPDLKSPAAFGFSQTQVRRQIVHVIMSSHTRIHSLGQIAKYAMAHNLTQKEPFRIQMTELSDNVGDIPYSLVHDISNENASLDYLRIEPYRPDIPFVALIAYYVGARRAADGTPMIKGDLLLIGAENLEPIEQLFSLHDDEEGPRIKYFDPLHIEEENSGSDEETTEEVSREE